MKKIHLWKYLFACIFFSFFSNNVSAQCRLLNEPFNVNPVLSPTNVDGTWYPDRYRPAGFVSDVLSVSNVLKISIDGILDGASGRGAQSGSFYNTQGRKFNQCGGCVTVMKGDLWIPADWATKHRRTDMWATAYDATNTVSKYPIIGFRNPDAASPGIYYWDPNIGWINSGVAVVYDSWINLEFRLAGLNIEYLVNGSIVGTIFSSGSTYFGDIIMQAYNFNDAAMPVSHGTPDLNPATNSYDAYWDNLITTGTGGNVVTNTNTGQTFCSIQPAIDASSPGDHIKVGPGNYFESASNRSVFGVNGPHKFGLFIDKDNLTIEGLDALNNTVTSAGNAAAVVTTNATNNFGSSGIFVQANGVTIKGLKIGDNFNDANVRANNKTIEVVGNGFTLDKTWISTATNEGAVYMGRWDEDHLILSYSLTNNKFENTLVSINNGVGLTGLRAGRVITGNEFTGVRTPYLIGFRGWNGAGPVQGWIVDPVGGAVVSGNSFNTTGVDKYVVARGNAGGYINSELDWAEIWNMNTYGNHVVTLTDYPSFNVRTYVDGAGYPETRRISPLIQENVNIGNTGDVVLVSAGTYNENVIVNKSLTLRGPNNLISPNGGVRVAEAIITGGLSVDNSASRTLVIEGFRFQGVTSPMVYNGNAAVTIAANFTFRKNLVNNSSGQLAVDLGTATNSAVVVLDDNSFVNMLGNAVQLNGGPGILNATVTNNSITGTVTAGINTNGISTSTFDGNTISNTGQQGIQVAGTASSVTISNNVITNANTSNAADRGGIRIRGGSLTGFVNITNNIISGSNNGIALPVGENITGKIININNNNLSGNTKSINHLGIGNLAATCNWYGSWTGPNHATNPAGTGIPISGNVIFSPWLTSGFDNNIAMPGFQPLPNICQGTPTMLTLYKCGKKNDKKVTICHNGFTICISNSDLQSHFDHGDKLGACSGNFPTPETKGATNLKEPIDLLPKDYKLSNYPNPFSLNTSILMELPEDSKLSLRVLDVTGREVATLVKESRKAGTYTIDFNASGLGSGVYYAILETTANGKVIIKSVKIVKQ